MVSAKQKKKRRRKLDLGVKKEFLYRGISVDELMQMSIDDSLPHLPARARRTLKRGLTHRQYRLLEKVRKTEKGTPIRTHLRNMVIIPEFIGHTFAVYNGKEYQPVEVQAEMVGHYLGEFALTRGLVKHSGPGVGATRSSKYMPLK
jgi:small subunit ribosomal protein S19